MHKRIDWPDFLFGLFLLLVATGTLVATSKLKVGSAANMGPGYMPRVIAIAVIGFGLFFVIRAVWRSLKGFEGLSIARVQLRPLLGIVIAGAVFALVVETAGLAIASVAAIVIAAFATREVRPLEAVIFGCVMAALSVLLFVTALSLPVPVWPPFLS